MERCSTAKQSDRSETIVLELCELQRTSNTFARELNNKNNLTKIYKQQQYSQQQYSQQKYFQQKMFSTKKILNKNIQTKILSTKIFSTKPPTDANVVVAVLAA